MKKLLFLLIFISFCFGQKRKEKPKVELKKEISKLNKAKGWILNDDEEWLSLRNKIPVPLESNLKSLLNHEEYGLGLDNFGSFKLHKIIFKNNDYLALIKTYANGYYKYKNIKEDWQRHPSYIVIVFEKSELLKFKNLKNNDFNEVKLTILDKIEIHFLGLTSSIEEVLTSKIDLSNKSSFPVFIAPYSDKKIVQFFIGEKPHGYENDQLKMLYYEATFKDFNKFISLEVK